MKNSTIGKVLALGMSAGVLTNSWAALAANTHLCEVREGTSAWVQNAISKPTPTSVWDIQFTTEANKFSQFKYHEERGEKGTKYRLPNTLSWNTLDIYFITNQSQLDNADKADLDNYAESLRAVEWDITINLEGFADARGWDKRNDYLSQKRAENVRAYLEEKLWRNVSFSIVSHGETKSNGADKARTLDEKLALRKFRRVSVSPSTSVIASGLAKSPADIYLLDASSSMIGDKWESVANYNFPDSAKIFTFNTNNNGENCAKDIGDQVVRWGTPLYESLLELTTNTTHSGKSITILSDGEADTYSLQEAVNNAKQNNITINVIGVASSDNASLRRIADATGWSFYFEGN